MNAPFVVKQEAEARLEGDELIIAPSLEKRRLQCYLVLMLGDLLALCAGFLIVKYSINGVVGVENALSQVQLILPIFLTIALYNGSYSVTALRKPWSGLWRSECALLLSVAAVVFIAFFAKASSEFSRIAFSSGTLCAMAALIVVRMQLRSFTVWRCGANPYNQLVIDDGGPRVDIPGAVRISANAMGLRANLNDPNALDRFGLVMRNIDRVVVSCPSARRADWAMMLKGANVDGEVLDDEVARLGAQGARVVNGHGLLLVSAGPLGLRERIIKRLLDVSAAGLAILFLSPLLLIVALAVKLQDGGPVFFIQRRMGRGNRFFDMYKFRSMSEGLCDLEGNLSASKGDQRVTRVGKFIRSTSIDELPQLFNVLLGDMSLVGPRPHAIGSQAGDKLFWEIDLRYWQRHCLKPGLSGLAQIRGFRGATEKETDLTDRLQSDLEYLEGWTIMRDIKIIFLTLSVLVHDRAF